MEKRAEKTHREVINEYNKRLTEGTDINDLPRIGPG